MQRYESYKPSGVARLGDIPGHWALKRVKHVHTVNPSGSSSRAGELVTFLPMEAMNNDGTFDIHRQGLRQLFGPSLTEFQVGDVLLAKITPCFENGKGALISDLPTQKGIGSTEFHVFRSSAEINPKFTYYLLHNDAFRVAAVPFMEGTAGQKRISTPFVKNLQIALPPRQEQDRIVTFLDQKTAEINDAIGKKEALIGLLQEQKTILINQAVTQGINASVPRRDSGVPWLGSIPAHWKVVPNRYVFREQNQRSLKGEETHLSMSQRYGLVPAKDLDIQTLQSESYDGAKLCREGDLVQNRLKAHLAVFGVAPCDGLVSPDYSVFRLRDQTNQPIFFERLFKTPGYLAEFNRRVRGIVVGFLRLYSEDFNAIPAIVPPADEQADIVKFINRVNQDFAAMQGKIEIEICALKEMRSALISESVTGKIKV
jgi:type I restriction enzyme S subunit